MSDSPPPAPAPKAPAATSSGWAPENRAKIERFLREHGSASPGYDAAHPPCATFDWDMTSIFNDVGEATFYYQVRHLYLKLTPAELDAMIPPAFQKTGASLADAKKETLDAYRALHDAGLVGTRPRGELSTALAVQADRFAYRMVWLYNKLDDVDGPLVAYPWLVKLYAHMYPAELARLSELVLADEVRKPGERCTTIALTHPTEPPIEIRHGIVTSPEMQELYRLLRANGFDVYVITASFKSAVEPIAARYGVRSDHVVGIRSKMAPDGTPTGEVEQPITYRAGKVANIEKFVPSPPLMAGGDSDTDVEMLLQPSLVMHLILDRKKSPTSDIGKLYERARKTDPEHWIIQGRDDYRADGTASGLWNGTTETRFDR